eukprot:468816-Pelagomonas_calceolata.AAC.6
MECWQKRQRDGSCGLMPPASGQSKTCNDGPCSPLVKTGCERFGPCLGPEQQKVYKVLHAQKRAAQKYLICSRLLRI